MQEYREYTQWVRCAKCGATRRPDVAYTKCPFDLSKWFDPVAWDKWAAGYAMEHGGRYPTRDWGQEWLACACSVCGYTWETKVRQADGA